MKWLNDPAKSNSTYAWLPDWCIVYSCDRTCSALSCTLWFT